MLKQEEPIDKTLLRLFGEEITDDEESDNVSQKYIIPKQISNSQINSDQTPSTSTAFCKNLPEIFKVF